MTTPPRRPTPRSGSQSGRRPGQRVRGAATGRLLRVLLELPRRRATLRALWELREGRRNVRELVEAAETNPSVLNARLAELRDAEVLEHGDDDYGLTARTARRGARSWGRSAPGPGQGGRAAVSHGVSAKQ